MAGALHPSSVESSLPGNLLQSISVTECSFHLLFAVWSGVWRYSWRVGRSQRHSKSSWTANDLPFRRWCYVPEYHSHQPSSGNVSCNLFSALSACVSLCIDECSPGSSGQFQTFQCSLGFCFAGGPMGVVEERPVCVCWTTFMEKGEPGP